MERTCSDLGSLINDRLAMSVAKTTALLYCPYYCVKVQRMGPDESDTCRVPGQRTILEVLGWSMFWSY